MLNGRSKGELPHSARGFLAGHFRTGASPVRRSHSNAHFIESSPRGREFKPFKPIKLSLSPRKHRPTDEKLCNPPPKPESDFDPQTIEVDQVNLFPGKHEDKPAIPFELTDAGKRGDDCIPHTQTEPEPLQSHSLVPLAGSKDAKGNPFTPSNSSSKAQLRTSLETALSALTPRLFSHIPGKPPGPEAEKVYHVFVGLIVVCEGGEAPGIFQMAHHKAWKALGKMGKTPGKLITSAKGLAKAMKHGTFPFDKWPNLMEDIQLCLLPKQGTDDVSSTLSLFLQSLLSHLRTHNLERELARRSLDYLEVESESPRKKLLQSLLNRSVEEKEKSPYQPSADPRGSHRTSEESKSDLSLTRTSPSPVRQNPFPEVTAPIDKVETPPKPMLRKPEPQDIKLNLATLRTRTPETGKKSNKSTPKTTPRKRKPAKSSDLDANSDTKLQFSALLFEVKFSVFLKEKAKCEDFRPPDAESDLRVLTNEFRSWVKESDESVADEALHRFVETIDLGVFAMHWDKIHEKDVSPVGEAAAPSWVQMSLKRDKAKLAMDFRPIRRK